MVIFDHLLAEIINEGVEGGREQSTDKLIFFGFWLQIKYHLSSRYFLHISHIGHVIQKGGLPVVERCVCFKSANIIF